MLLVVDNGNQHARILKLQRNAATVFVGEGSAIPATAAGKPVSKFGPMALLSDGGLVISDDGNGRILKLINGELTVLIGKDGVVDPGKRLVGLTNLAVLSDNSILVADHNRLFKYKEDKLSVLVGKGGIDPGYTTGRRLGTIGSIAVPKPTAKHVFAIVRGSGDKRRWWHA